MKSGLDFFPLDVCLDEKFELIEAEFGLKGFAVVIKLLQRIYGQQGYYCEWTEEVALLFGKSLSLGSNVVSEIVSASVRRGLFDKTLYEKYRILTSKGIQKRYFEAAVRRKSVEVKKEYLLLSDIRFYKNVSISSVNVNISKKNVDISQHSRVEHSRAENRREEYSDMPESAEAAPARRLLISIPLNDKSEYPVYQDQVDSWSELFPAVDIPQELRKMKGWCEANPSKRKTKRGILRFINNWLSGEQDKGGTRSGRKNDQRSGDAAEIPKGESLGIQL